MRPMEDPGIRLGEVGMPTVIVCEECGTVCESCAASRAEVRRLRAEVRRYRAWVRRWRGRFLYSVKTLRAVKAMQPDTFAEEINDCLAGEPVPRRGRGK